MVRSSPFINHIFFVDDTIIFYRAKLKEWIKIQNDLDIYEAAADQGISKSKTEIFFSANANNIAKGQILNSVGVSLCNNQEKYLGLPMMVSRNRYCTFEMIKDKIWARIHNWKNTFLSQVKKEVLLKLVVQDIPKYAMSMF